MPPACAVEKSRPTAADRADLESVTRVINQLAEKRETTLPDGRTRSINEFAVSNAAGLILERAAAASPAGSVVEVGCASGLSTLHIARGRLSAGLLSGPDDYHAIDPKQRTHWDSIGRMHLTQAGLDSQVTLHERPAHGVLPELLAGGTRVGFAFIDGWHMLDYVMVEAFYIDHMLEVGGVIAIHDLWMPGLQHFACFWLTNRPYEAVTVVSRGGRSEFSPAPCESADRAVGDLRHAPPSFGDRIVPYVDQSVLLLRKRGPDQRKWDDFQPYNEA